MLNVYSDDIDLRTGLSIADSPLSVEPSTRGTQADRFSYDYEVIDDANQFELVVET